MRDRIDFTPIAPYPQPAEAIQGHIGDVGRALQTLGSRLETLVRRIAPESGELLTTELRDGVKAVCNDLLADAAATLCRLSQVQADQIVQRHAELIDLSERLAAHGAR